MKLNKNMINAVEQNISPSMAKAITIPVNDNDGLPITIYVVASQFGKRVTRGQLIAVAERVTLKE